MDIEYTIQLDAYLCQSVSLFYVIRKPIQHITPPHTVSLLHSLFNQLDYQIIWNLSPFIQVFLHYQTVLFVERVVRHTPQQVRDLDAYQVQILLELFAQSRLATLSQTNHSYL